MILEHRLDRKWSGTSALYFKSIVKQVNVKKTPEVKSDNFNATNHLCDFFF